jgi:hypothetical protein
MAIDRLTIEDMSDREFLLAVHDLREDDGWTDSEAIRERLDLAERRIASTRLSWLARWGAVEREYRTDEDDRPRLRKNGAFFYTQRWRLTVAGAALAHGQLRPSQLNWLDRVDDTQLLQATAWLAQRMHSGGDVTAKLIQREWRYSTAPLGRRHHA